jgi:hypothetical protein
MAHKSTDTLVKKLDKAKEKVQVGGRYSHYKHPEQSYTVLRIGFIESSEEVSVVYEAEYGEKFVWVRTLEDFTAKAKKEDGTQVDRFTKIS